MPKRKGLKGWMAWGKKKMGKAKSTYQLAKTRKTKRQAEKDCAELRKKGYACSPQPVY